MLPYWVSLQPEVPDLCGLQSWKEGEKLTVKLQREQGSAPNFQLTKIALFEDTFYKMHYKMYPQNFFSQIWNLVAPSWSSSKIQRESDARFFPESPGRRKCSMAAYRGQPLLCTIKCKPGAARTAESERGWKVDRETTESKTRAAANLQLLNFFKLFVGFGIGSWWMFHISLFIEDTFYN